MSHVTTGTIRITALQDLEKAVERIGGKFMRGQTTHAWFGRWMNDWNTSQSAVQRGFDPKTFGTCLHAVRIPGHEDGDYEVGVVKHQSGKGYDLIYDLWGGKGKKIHAAFGDKLAALKTEVGIAATKRVYRGRRVEVKRHSPERATIRVHER